MNAPAERASFLRYPEIGPIIAREHRRSVSGVTVFREESGDGADDFRLGSAYSHGPATAGIAMSYSGETPEPSRSDVFVDYALNEHVSIGVSGLLAPAPSGGRPVTRLGVNAAMTGAEGAILSGTIAQTGSEATFVGLSLGLRF